MEKNHVKTLFFKKFYIFLIITIIFILIILFAFFAFKNNKKEYFSHSGEENFYCEDCNIIFISMTNLRQDHLGTYGYYRDTSPNIDRLAQESLVFENAFSHASWTLPVAVSLFTSQYPFTHGIMDREEEAVLNESTITFVDILKQNGYITAGFFGDRDYSQKFGHTSRFDTVYDYVNENQLKEWKKYGVYENTVPKAIEWLKNNKENKFFMFVQGYDAHCPFSVPNENKMFDPKYNGGIDFTQCYWTFKKTEPIFNEKGEEIYLLKTATEEGEGDEVRFYKEDVEHMSALYDGEIYNSDKQIQKILDQVISLGIQNKTIIVFFSEHGDMFGKYGRFMRGGPLRGTFYDDVLKIPLIIYHPTLYSNRLNSLVQIIDLAPTILDILKIDSPKSFQGKSLKPLITENKTVNKYVFAGSVFTPKETNKFFRYSSTIIAVRSLDWKLILEKLSYPDEEAEYDELFDLNNDKDELNNIASENTKVFNDMNSTLYKWLKQIKKEKLLLEPQNLN